MSETKTFTIPLNFTTDVENGTLKFDTSLANADDAMVAGLVHQGIRVLFQRVNATTKDKKLTDLQKRDNYAKLVKSLNDGSWRPGSIGSAPIDDVEVELRLLLTAQFVDAGFNKTAATNMAREENRLDLYRDHVIKRFLLRNNPDILEEPDTYAEVVEKNWAALRVSAAETVAARKAKLATIKVIM
jgi:nicotinamidase-related amidase